MRVVSVLFAAIATARAIHLRPRVAPRPAPVRLGALAPAALDGARTRVAALRMAEAESEGQEEDVEVIPLLAAGVAALGAVALVATSLRSRQNFGLPSRNSFSLLLPPFLRVFPSLRLRLKGCPVHA